MTPLIARVRHRFVFLQSVGIGKLRINFVIMGYKNNWDACEPDELLEYFALIQ